jgi:hypothetical protein
MRRPIALAVVVLTSGAAQRAHALEEAMPPWTDPGDVPVPAWARSVTPNRAEAAIYSEPGKLDQRCFVIRAADTRDAGVSRYPARRRSSA